VKLDMSGVGVRGNDLEQVQEKQNFNFSRLIRFLIFLNFNLFLKT
jgi:hypothetical protein